MMYHCGECGAVLRLENGRMPGHNAVRGIGKGLACVGSRRRTFMPWYCGCVTCHSPIARQTDNQPKSPCCGAEIRIVNLWTDAEEYRCQSCSNLVEIGKTELQCKCGSKATKHHPSGQVDCSACGLALRKTVDGAKSGVSRGD